ncbi:MAG: hypothetical protein ABIU06_20520 [Anaerolineales bacterium]
MLNPSNRFKTVRVVSGSIEWQGEIDLSYNTLYLTSLPVKTSKVRSKTTRVAKKKQAAIPLKRTRQTRAEVGAK